MTIKIISKNLVCNSTCTEVVFKEGRSIYTAVISPNSGIISENGEDYKIIDDITRNQLIDVLAKNTR